MGFVLISATPSPYARMNRIAMLEKGIPFELQNEIPWHKAETQTPKYNPLEKLPILLDPQDPDFEPVYNSTHIQEYLMQKFPGKGPLLLTGNIDLDLKARQIQVLSTGVMDALVLKFFESTRAESKQSREWMERQQRKVDGGLRAMNDLVVKRPGRAEGGGDHLVGDGKTYTIADIAVACAVGHLDFAGGKEDWKAQYPELAEWFQKMDAREHFASTRPVMFDIKTDTVV
ncbi:hypothetical protein N0V82_010625 [Gnomoniopsis sp. IMI 355080]|nr:hypothetical protein N0V82_010625 [Gnomoniopsis sp. IMI 355080]